MIRVRCAGLVHEDRLARVRVQPVKLLPDVVDGVVVRLRSYNAKHELLVWSNQRLTSVFWERLLNGEVLDLLSKEIFLVEEELNWLSWIRLIFILAGHGRIQVKHEEGHLQ